MVQLTNNGMTVSGDADFSGKPFQVQIFSSWSIAGVLENIIASQTYANNNNRAVVSTYNNAVLAANRSNGGTAPPTVIPKMQVVPDYPSDATALNPVGTGAGQPIINEVDFPDGMLTAIAVAPVVVPSAGLSTLAGEPPAWAVMLWTLLNSVASDVTAIKKHYGA